MAKRAVITGMGIICGIGHNKDQVLESIKSCRSGIDIIRKFDVSKFDRQYGCEVKNYRPQDHFDRQALEYANLCTQFALIAIGEAMGQSRLNLSSVNPADVGICVGSSHGSLDVIYDLYKKMAANDRSDITRNYLFRRLHASILKVVAHKYKINGISSMISTACASGSNALGMAADWIWSGRAKYVLAGGSDVLDQSLHAGFWALKAVSANPCSPFSGEPGISLGEGAAFFIIEDSATAIERHAPILAEILGYGLSGDAYHATSPDPQGLGVKLAIGRAVEDARIRPEDIEYVNAHGTGTDGNDQMETIAHVDYFAERAPHVPVSSTKSYFGHATGAAGTLEACVSIMCMHDGILPPTLNFTSPRYNYPIDYIPNTIRKKKINVFMSNSFGFAGNNAVIVLGRYDDARIAPADRFKKTGVAITGIGIVSPIGIGHDEFGKALQEKKNGIAKIKRFNADGSGSPYGCLIENFQPNRHYRQINADRRMDLVSQFSTVAASLCLDDAGVSKKRKDTKDIGIIMCVSSAPRQGIYEHLKKMVSMGPNYPSSIFFPYSTQNSSLGHVNINLGLQGFTSNLHVDGCTGLNGLMYGQMAIQSGRQQRILVGGGDEVYWSYFEEMSLLNEVSRKNSPYVPFSEDERGYHPGEGGAFMLLESMDEAVQRNAKIYAEVLGFGMTTDSNPEMTENDPTGSNLIKAVEAALASGNVGKDEVAWIGCTERGIDTVRQAEYNGIRHFWGDQLKDISLINTIPFTGWLDSVSPLMNLSAMIYSAQNKEAIPRHAEAGSTPFAPALMNKKPASERGYGICLGVAREGYNYALLVKPHV